jgi:transcription antitermination factor NusG
MESHGAPDDRWKRGERVRLRSGVFAGFRGRIASIHRTTSVVSVKIRLFDKIAIVDEPSERLERIENQ